MSLKRTGSLFVALLLTLSFSASAHMADQPKGKKKNKTVCFPTNKLYLEDDLDAESNVSEEQFNTIIDNIIKHYKPIVKAHGYDLVAEKNWDDGTVNAYASQEGNVWKVAMFGGLARRPEVTPDGFALVVCHELGHHLAGYPFYGDNDWASSEGQSDYFATQACAKIGWGQNFKKNIKFKQDVDSVAQEECDATFKKPEARALCYREAMAGQSLATLLAKLGGDTDPEFDTPDTSKVDQTSPYHPAAQCRLDTYFAGALCTKSFDSKIIPARNKKGGQDSVTAEKEAAKYSCMANQGFEVGFRPRCWFKPLATLR